MEIWQIEVGGKIYEANFDVLAQWIFEGSLLPQDKVRRGNLRWIEAQKIPALAQFFNDKIQGLAPPVVNTVNGPSNSSNGNFPNGVNDPLPPASFPIHPTQPSENQNFIQNQPVQQITFHSPTNQIVQNPPQFSNSGQNFNNISSTGCCVIHTETPAVFVCETCSNVFCKTCPNSYGGSVKICPFCGALCNPLEKVQKKQEEVFQYQGDLQKGFGFDDFIKAIAYPFKFKVSLFFGAVMFTIFSMGQLAVSFGSFFLVGSAVICFMLANMLTFGVLANTVDNFSQGKIGGNFMPGFDDFSIWDDVVQPFFMSLGIYIISFGLVILIIIGSLIGGLNRVSNSINELYTDSDKARKLQDLNDGFKNDPAMRKQVELYQNGEMPDEKTISNSQGGNGFNSGEEQARRMNEFIKEQRQKQLESTFGKTPETQKEEQEQLIKGFLGMPSWILILLGIGLLWGFFYFPVACCVAGYTRSFSATLNPAIGLETIKILGLDYVKIWFMGFLMVVVSSAIGLILGMALKVFDLPTIGNVPVKIISSFIGFYFSVVFSIILGFALYKNSDKLKLFNN